MYRSIQKQYFLLRFQIISPLGSCLVANIAICWFHVNISSSSLNYKFNHSRRITKTKWFVASDLVSRNYNDQSRNHFSRERKSLARRRRRNSKPSKPRRCGSKWKKSVLKSSKKIVSAKCVSDETPRRSRSKKPSRTNCDVSNCEKARTSSRVSSRF